MNRLNSCKLFSVRNFSLAILFSATMTTAVVLPGQEPSNQIRFIQHRGVKIVFETEADMFPDYWVKSYDTSATALKKSEIDRSLRIAKRALERYPSSLLKQTLKKIYLVDTLRFSGITAGGTYYRDRLYIANKGIRLGYTDRFLVQSIHHEFSSILLNRFKSKFDQEAWLELNPASFQYGSSGTQAVKDGRDSLNFNQKLAEKGFICEYAQSSWEEDFNTIAARLFSADSRFWKHYDDYPRLRQKIDFVIDFYGSISTQFDYRHFRGTNQNRE